jgi:hypothetical protein
VNGGVAAVPDGDPARRSAASLYPFLPHVFDRFYRATQSRGLPGAGLGLAIVCQVADAHGGAVAATERRGRRAAAHVPADGGVVSIQVITSFLTAPFQHLS